MLQQIISRKELCYIFHHLVPILQAYAVIENVKTNVETIQGRVIGKRTPEHAHFTHINSSPTKVQVFQTFVVANKFCEGREVPHGAQAYS